MKTMLFGSDVWSAMMVHFESLKWVSFVVGPRDKALGLFVLLLLLLSLYPPGSMSKPGEIIYSWLKADNGGIEAAAEAGKAVRDIKQGNGSENLLRRRAADTEKWREREWGVKKTCVDRRI